MRRPDVRAVHSLDHVVFDVPDVEEARRFYTAFGLDVKGTRDELSVCAYGDPRPWLVVRKGQGPRKALRWLSFGAYEDDLPAIVERLEKHGKRVPNPPGAAETSGPFFAGARGVVVEVRAADKRTIDERELHPEAPKKPGRNAPLRSEAWPVRPTRLSHALLFTPDMEESIAFFSGALGLRLSDHAGAVAFLHAPHGSDHHVIAFAKGPASGLHHVSWAVPSFDDVGLGAMQMAAEGWARGWGVGRHVLGSNYFYYVRDPWGSYSEYSFDIDHVPSHIDWPASQQSPENGFYFWGPSVPEDFTTNYEVEGTPDAH